MADLHVEKFDLMNPFVLASSPATQGAKNVLKIAECRPGAIVLRNFGHGMGGGSFFSPGADAFFKGEQAFHSHAVGTQLPDPIKTLDQYCEEVRTIKKSLDKDIKLWVSVGHYSDIVKGGDWEGDWKKQARELVNAGADALELHFNTPGIAVAKDRQFNYYQLVESSTRMIKSVCGGVPVMVKLAIESCDSLTSMRAAANAGADGVGPTARWKGFYFDLDWKRTQARPGSGYGGTQANPIVCYAIADARGRGIDTPMYAGGGVFSYDQALRIIMAGSEMVQLGTAACSGGAKACRRIIRDFSSWMDEKGYADMKSLTGAALELFNMDGETSRKRTTMLGEAYRTAAVSEESCTGCGKCVDVCWHEGIEIRGKKAVKLDTCIGCGYCFQVCPVSALSVDAGTILEEALR